jgi:short-subunit dehydrogenase
MNKPFAIVTGASAGIGLELAAICAQEGYDLLVAADRPEIQSAADRFRGLVHLVGRAMRSRGQGRILLTGSIAGFIPGTYQAVYNGTKAFVDSFSFAVRAELKDTGVTVTCLMPGATETDFFARADMLDTKVSQGKKDDPADVARVGFDAMMRGDGDVVSGWQNKLQSAIANVTPAGILAEQHRRMAEPGSATKAYE